MSKQLQNRDMVIDPVTQGLGIRCALNGDGRCTATLEAGEEHCNIFGVIHGAILFAMADVSMGNALAAAVNYERKLASVNINANYMRVVRAGNITAEARILQRGRTIATLQTEVRDADGKVCAIFTGNFHISSQTGEL